MNLPILTIRPGKKFFFLLSLLLLALPCLASAQTYTVTDLGSLGGKTSVAAAISSNGHVTGWSVTSHGEGHAFLFKDGKMSDIGLSGGRYSSGVSINAKDQVVGQASLTPYYFERGYLFEDGNVIPIGTKASVIWGNASGINGSSQITGMMNSNRDSHAYILTGNQIQDLGAIPGYPISCGNGINNKGEVVGYLHSFIGASAKPLPDNEQAFWYHQGKMDALGTLGGQKSIANAVNDSGQIVGYLETNSLHLRAFLLYGGKMMLLGVLPHCPDNIALGINAQGQVVGKAFDFVKATRAMEPGGPGVERKAFVYRAGKMSDLNLVIPPHSGWILESADGINARGQIVGTGRYRGNTRAFLLTPTH